MKTLEDWKDAYYEQQANHTEARGILTDERDRAIARAEAAERALSEGTTWISVKDRTPERDVVVITFEANGCFTSIESWPRFGAGVTHWMPLPEAPK